MNLYSYCHNNPVTYVDPSGNACYKKYQAYKNEGDSGVEAGIKSKYDELKRTQGKTAADKYLNSQVNKLKNKGYEFSDAWKNGSESGKYTYTNSSDITKNIRRSKPLNSPDIDKWYKKQGTISIDENGVWTYHDWEGNSVSYQNGYPDFKSAGMVKHYKK